MMFRFKFYCFLLIFSYLISSTDNLFGIISSSRNVGIGSIHISSDNISSIFDGPILKNKIDKTIFFSTGKYGDLFNVYHFSSNIYNDDISNLSIGIVRREISDIFNTQLLVQEGVYPSLENLNYDNIYSYSDSETGMLISYNKFLNNNFIINLNFKPIFHQIDNINAVGSSFDLRYLYFLKDLKLILAVDNILSFKKWDTGEFEKNNIDGFISIEKKINDLSTIFTEFNIVDGFKIGYELKIQNNIFVRIGRNDANSSFGLGFNFSSIKLDYAYVKNENNFFYDSHRVGFNFNLQKELQN